jgi:hypothetical protein
VTESYGAGPTAHEGGTHAFSFQQEIILLLRTYGVGSMTRRLDILCVRIPSRPQRSPLEGISDRNSTASSEYDTTVVCGCNNEIGVRTRTAMQSPDVAVQGTDEGFETLSTSLQQLAALLDFAPVPNRVPRCGSWDGVSMGIRAAY